MDTRSTGDIGLASLLERSPRARTERDTGSGIHTMTLKRHHRETSRVLVVANHVTER